MRVLDVIPLCDNEATLSNLRMHDTLTMHIVIIAWLFVVLMMAITEKSAVGGVLTFVLYGLAPCALLLWLVATQRKALKQHRQRRAATQSVAQESAKKPDGQDAGADQQNLQQ